jgi:hypothetical protein
MKKKYIEQRFGKCPRVYCQNQSMLPVGMIKGQDVILNVYSIFVKYHL